MAIRFKENFLERYSKLTDIETFKEVTIRELRRSIRINTLKISEKELLSRLSNKWKLEKIPWCDQSYFMSGERRDIGNLLEHNLGYYYIQEAASMIPPIVLDPNEDDIILDMAAAPGSKTTQMAAMMKNNGLIVANDYDADRIKSLGINLQRCGVTNSIITIMHGLQFKGYKFDKVLLDAPCSGTGAIRKSLNTLKMYNVKMITKLSNMQKKLIINAYMNLKEGGDLVYSTCSLEPEENEEVIDHLLNNFPNAKVHKIDLDIKRSNPIVEFQGDKYSDEVKKCLRLWPQDNDTEGFFIAHISKA